MSKPNPKRPAKSSSRKPTARDTGEKDESADRAASSRSTLAGSGGGGGSGAAGGGTGSATRTPTDAEAKDEITTNGDKKDAKADDAATTPAAPKPVSASATLRDASQRLLTLTMKQEWNSIDPVLKQMEKIVASGGGELYAAPLAGIMDPVKNKFIFHFILIQNYILFFLLSIRMTFESRRVFYECISFKAIVKISKTK